jgi:hypothetical protein
MELTVLFILVQVFATSKLWLEPVFAPGIFCTSYCFWINASQVCSPNGVSFDLQVHSLLLGKVLHDIKNKQGQGHPA